MSDVNDIADIFTWLATKSWFNGRVGMRGGSYGGATQWLATRAKNPILKVIVPEVISPDMWKTCYRQNGVWIGKGRHGGITQPHPNSERDVNTQVNLSIPGIGKAMTPINRSTFRSDILARVNDGKLDVPPFCLFVMGINQHRGFDRWPVPETVYRNCYLTSPLGERTGSLTNVLPGSEAPSEYDYDPSDPVPTLGGTCTNDTLTEGTGSFDQRPIQDRDDVLVFTSEPLTDHTAVVGRIRVKLWAASSGRDTDFIAKLVDVYPDGRAFNVCEGILRARFRNSIYDVPQLLVPDQVYQMEIKMHSTANVFMQGHRIQLMIQSSNFPMWDRNLNTGHDPDTDDQMVVGHQKIFHDADHPTRIILPVTSRYAIERTKAQ